MAQAIFRIWRGDSAGGEFQEYKAEVGEGMVVLDAVHQIQATQAPDLACRWNCKAGKCGSCSAEINGTPRLMCMTRMDDLPLDIAGHHRADAGIPANQGPGHRRVVELPGQARDPAVQAAQARRGRTAPGGWRRKKSIGCRNSASASSASCARTSATCCAITSKHEAFIGPRFLVYVAGSGDAPARHGRPRRGSEGKARHRPVQHHQVLHRRCVPSTSPSPTTPSFR